MGIDTEFERTFGLGAARRQASRQQQAAKDLPKAQFWINIGYIAEGTAGDDGKDKFVSLPVGLPLDTMEPVNTRSSNADYAAFQGARNKLLDQFIAQAQRLAPGEDVILPIENSFLAIQIRRVNADQPAPPTDSSNRYVKDLFTV